MKENDINQLCNVYDLCKSELIAGCVQASEKDVQEWWKSCQQLLHSEKSDFRTKEKVILILTKLLAEKSELLGKTEKLETELAELRARLDKTIELPSGDRVWYIAEDEEGQESYIISKPTGSLTVEELKYAMDKKYFSTREEAAESRARRDKAVELHY